MIIKRFIYLPSKKQVLDPNRYDFQIKLIKQQFSENSYKPKVLIMLYPVIIYKRIIIIQNYYSSVFLNRFVFNDYVYKLAAMGGSFF